MSDAKDPAIKLFGKTIPLPDIAPGCSGLTAGAAASVEVPVDGADRGDDGIDEERDSSSNKKGDDDDKQTSGLKPIENKKGDGPLHVITEELAHQDGTLGVSESPRTPSVDEESIPLKTAKSEEEQSDTSTSQEKTLKKPDKILPCPRCNSMDTKFCYYNNYNVNQPRYFCKNCQRYWTAGGTMRNVPVGAGRRKNKNSSSHCHQIAVSEALHNARTDVPNGMQHPSLQPNGTVLAFGTDTPLCESMASVLSLAEQATTGYRKTEFEKPDELTIPASAGGRENGDVRIGGSFVLKDEAGKSASQEMLMHNCQGLPPQMPCFPGAPWPYPLNPIHWSSPVPPPAFCPPGFPMPFYPAAYWGCSVPAGSWNIPWLAPPPPPSNQSSPSSSPNSPTLGKHSRDENTLKTSNAGEDEPLKENNSGRSLWIPKTLRINDPGEAAKSSIWETLGIKNDNDDPMKRGELLKAFRSKIDQKSPVAEKSALLHANPAALSRSLNFQESS